jgi:oxygen-independent coproporphyrinogen-3 oxidase
MWPWYPDLLARPVPRYTSFPTAAEFAPFPRLSPLAQAFADLPEGTSLSLYLHIPFCQEICWYCGCNTARSNKAERLTVYLEAVEAELALVGQSLPRGARVGRVSLGGGSPNALGPDLLLRLWDRLAATLPLSAETVVSVETDPRTLDATFTRALAAIGISRASLGVQTFTADVQARIGRVQPEPMIARATDLLRAAGVTSLNFDLMYGLPGQHIDDVTDAVARTLRLGADRVALFGYAHVPSVVPRQRRIAADALPTAHERFLMAEAGHALLEASGFRPAGFDHFARSTDPLSIAAKKGRLARNFQGFTDDCAEAVIGVGASAISGFPGLLVQNEKNSGRYRMLTLAGRFAATLGVERSPEDRLRAAVITDILCLREADLAPLLPDPVAIEGLSPFLSRGLATLHGQRLSLDAQATPYARAIAALFDPYRNHAATRFSSAI